MSEHCTCGTSDYCQVHDQIESLRARLAEAERERDALAAAMPSEGADAAIGYAAMRARCEEAEALLRAIRDGVRRADLYHAGPDYTIPDRLDAFLGSAP